MKGLYYRWGVNNRPYLRKISIKRRKFLHAERISRIRETVRLINDISQKGFAFTNNLQAFVEVVDYMKSNHIPYEYISGDQHWTYAVRRLDRRGDANVCQDTQA